MEAPEYLLLDERRPDVRVEFGMARAEVAQRSSTRAFAEQLAAIDATLREAREFPEVFVGPLAGSMPDAVEFAERAAIADLAVRLCLSEQTVRAQAHEAEVLLHRAPRVWFEFREGEISAPNAAIVAEIVGALPAEAWAPFERAVCAAAGSLAPPRFRTFARTARERVHAEQLTERRRRRSEERRVWVEPDIDGMSWLHAYLPADVAGRAMSHLDRVAVTLAGAPDERRTVAQLRADVAGDLLAGVLGSGGGSAGVSISVTVPVLSLLGASEEPATLEGYGPIDAETARRLAAHAPSFHRILTHPISGAILDVDRTSYRVPADLKRWVEARDQTCTFVGCGRLAKNCDIDHTLAWEHDGKTKDDNLALLCRHHHRLKHQTAWHMTQDADVRHHLDQPDRRDPHRRPAAVLGRARVGAAASGSIVDSGRSAATGR